MKMVLKLLLAFVSLMLIYVGMVAYRNSKAENAFKKTVASLDAEFKNEYPVGTKYKTLEAGLEKFKFESTTSIKKEFSVLKKRDQIEVGLVFRYGISEKIGVFVFNFDRAGKLVEYKHETRHLGF